MLTTTSRSFLPRQKRLQAEPRTTNPKLAIHSVSEEDPDKGGWDETIRPKPGEERKVEVGRRAGADTD